MPQLLEDQRILIGGIGDLNKPSDHGGLPTLLRPLFSCLRYF
jgi:hypothetical protein